MKCHEEIQHGNAAQTVVELCAIRDGVSDCDTQGRQSRGGWGVSTPLNFWY